MSTYATQCHNILDSESTITFYPRDAMLAMAPCPSVTRRCSTKRDEQINLVFDLEASFVQPYAVF